MFKVKKAIPIILTAVFIDWDSLLVTQKYTKVISTKIKIIIIGASWVIDDDESDLFLNGAGNNEYIAQRRL